MSKRRSISRANLGQKSRRTLREPVLPLTRRGQPRSGTNSNNLRNTSMEGTPTTTSGNPNPESTESRRLILIRDNAPTYPELWCKVFIQADIMETSLFTGMFARARCKRADSPEDADFVIFGGGSDVDPVLYGENPHSTTHFNPQRDSQDLALYMQCLDQGIPMIGVCRGAQFLHVMNGGKLFQDVDEHYGEHSMWDIKKGMLIPNVSSVHHQMCRPNKVGGMEIVAEAHISKERWCNPHVVQRGKTKDIEAFFYRDSCCFGVQGHPEYSGYSFFTNWFLECVHDYIVVNPDVGWNRDMNHIRVKKDILDLRKTERQAIAEANKKEAN